MRESLIKELQTIKEYDDIDKNIKASVNYNIAMFYFMNKRYKEAYPFFLENIVKYNRIREMIFIGSICSYLRCELPDCFNEINYHSSNYKLYIDYYKFKKEGKTCDELVEYIMYTLLYEKLIHVVYVQPLWKIFENEMFIMLESSRKHYKSYIKYKKMMDKICK